MEDTSHLGGHCGITHTDIGALQWLKSMGVKSLLDVGCSVGGQIKEASDLGIEAWGVEGDESIKSKTDMAERIYFQDLTKDWMSCITSKGEPFDAVWSVEVSEHIEEKFLDNYFLTLSTNLKDDGFLIFTCSQNPGGIHHVTIKQPGWWENKLFPYGLSYDNDLTNLLKVHSTMRRRFIQETGMIFVKNPT